MTMNRHESFEELISASLTDELTTAERQRLDAHLDSCSQCRTTLAAFADQRRIMTGLRHVAPPRDLGARVRTGIERGRFASLPWWRRPAVVFVGVGGGLAAVTGALLAIVLLNGSPAERNVGLGPSSTPFVETTESPSPSLPTIPPPTPNASPSQSAPAPSVSSSPPSNPVAVDPEPDIVLTMPAPSEEVPPSQGAVAISVREGPTGTDVPLEAAGIEGATEPEAPSGPPIAAELSPDGQWLAYITEIGLRGVNDVWATRLTEAPDVEDPDGMAPVDSTLVVGTTVHLGESAAGSPFLERLAWSSDGRYLAYTLADPETVEPDADAWVFDTGPGEPRRLTDAGNAFAGSWVPGTAGTSLLWVSTAGEQPISHLMALHDDAGGDGEPIDPADGAVAEAEGVFQPLLSPDGSLAIYWRGRMEAAEELGWTFVEGGEPYLAKHDADAGIYDLTDERPLFSGLPNGERFRSAAITWGLDGDAYAVWDMRLTEETGDAVPYPDPRRIYFGHATDARGLTNHHALDAEDIGEELAIVDVKVAPTGRHLVITARERPGGVMDVPRSVLRLVTRNTGNVPDTFEDLGTEDGWIGPAVFQPDAEAEWDSSLAP